MSIGLWRKVAAFGALVAVAVLSSACTGSNQAIGTGAIGVSAQGTTPAGVQQTSSAPVTVSPLTPTPSTTGTSSSSTTTSSTTSTSSSPLPPAATVTGSPALGSTDIAPAEQITVTAHGGTLKWVTFTNPDGKKVKGALSEDETEWTLGEPLGYGKTYTVKGVATNAIGVQTPIKGTYTTATTIEPITTSISPGDGDTVGVAMPVIVRFGIRPDDKALIEKHVKIVTDPPVEGAWAWITHTGDTYPSLDWRPKKYWPAGTKVHVESNIYGVKFQDGWYGGDDVSVDFTIGRNQVVKANAKTQVIKVLRDGKVVDKFHGSFGRGDRVGDPNLVTRSGIHVVMDKHPEYKMTNLEYGYEDVQEYWAVRISNNGEFLHNNPETSPWALANENITHGCINLSWDDAKSYFESAMRGDPVEITGTSIQLSAADGDIYDWTIPWKKWKTLSALSPHSTVA